MVFWTQTKLRGALQPLQGNKQQVIARTIGTGERRGALFQDKCGSLEGEHNLHEHTGRGKADRLRQVIVTWALEGCLSRGEYCQEH